MNPPFAKRSLRPTASLPTTAEVYGEKFGIDPAVQLALQNIGRKSRQNIAQPSFNRTATTPNISFTAPYPPSAFASGSASGSGFQTSHEIMEQARGIVNKEAWRRSTRELQPFGSGSDIGSNDAATNESGQPRPHAHTGMQGADQYKTGIKRTNAQDEDEAEDDDDGGTEVDEDEPAPTMDTVEDEFPPVFQSPHLTQPELFHRQALPQAAKRTDRLTRGLPARNALGGRTLGKTVSAPVGGLWGSGGDVDMDAGAAGGLQDGFDISEWSKEEF